MVSQQLGLLRVSSCAALRGWPRGRSHLVPKGSVCLNGNPWGQRAPVWEAGMGQFSEPALLREMGIFATSLTSLLSCVPAPARWVSWASEGPFPTVVSECLRVSALVSSDLVTSPG